MLPQLARHKHAAGAINLDLRHIRDHIVHEQPTFTLVETLALYLEHQKVDADRRETLLRYARSLMADEAEVEGCAATPAVAHAQA